MKAFSPEALWKKYKYAILIAAVGVTLMLIPGRKQETAARTAKTADSDDVFSLEETERKMEAILGQIEGTGKLRIMLTLAAGSQVHLASDADQSLGDGMDGSRRIRQEVVRLNTGSGTQEVVVVGRIYPRYQGAVIVCQGADNAAVRLALTEAVSALTGLGSDRISIVKWRES
jgi:stage III sporulation protein AG